MPLVAACTKCKTENNVTGDTRLESASHDLTLWPCPGCGSYCVVREVPRTDAPRPQRIEEPAVPIEATKPARNEWTQDKLPGLEGGRAQKTANIPEEEIQRETIRRLESCGYLVEQTTVRLRAQICPSCKQVHGYSPVRPKGKECGGYGPAAYGTTPTIADLLVRNPKWAPGIWIQLEIKGSKTPVDNERAGPQGMTQKDMMIAGHIFVCRSAETACTYVMRVDQILRGINWKNQDAD